MRQYKIEILNGEMFVIEFEPAPTHFQDVKHGPYKNRKSAQNRIRTLSKTDVHGNLTTPYIVSATTAIDQNDETTIGEFAGLPLITQPQVIRQVGCYPAIPKSAYRR